MFCNELKYVKRRIKELRKNGHSEDVLLIAEKQIERAVRFREMAKAQKDSQHKKHTYQRALNEITFVGNILRFAREIDNREHPKTER